MKNSGEVKRIAKKEVYVARTGEREPEIARQERENSGVGGAEASVLRGEGNDGVEQGGSWYAGTLAGTLNELLRVRSK